MKNKNALLNFWKEDRMYILLMGGLLLFVLTIVYIEATSESYTIECYKGHKYRVNKDGVLRPMTTKYGVQRCD